MSKSRSLVVFLATGAGLLAGMLVTPAASATTSPEASYIAYVDSVVPGLHWSACGVEECGSNGRGSGGIVSVDKTGISLASPLLTNGSVNSELVAFGIESSEVVTHFAGPAAARWMGDEVAAGTSAFFLENVTRTFGTWSVEVNHLARSGNDIYVTLVHV